MDFTLKKYKSLLESFLASGYSIVTFESFLKERPAGKFLVLRHDVDELAGNALKMARLEHSLGICATYFFRIVRQSNNPVVIREIVSMGHEVGYHYEDLSMSKGDSDIAIASFENNLKYFKQFYPVKTICMHGSSSSKYDNRELWTNNSLSDYDLLGEPYLSIDFNQLYYITDTGYAWDGGRFAVRDIVQTPFQQKYHRTDQVIAALQNATFPRQTMMLAHTLWTDSYLQWFWLHCREYVRNRVKLLAKNNKFVQKLYNRLVMAYWKR